MGGKLSATDLGRGDVAHIPRINLDGLSCSSAAQERFCVDTVGVQCSEGLCGGRFYTWDVDKAGTFFPR